MNGNERGQQSHPIDVYECVWFLNKHYTLREFNYKQLGISQILIEPNPTNSDFFISVSISLVCFFFGSLDWGIFDCGDLVLDHWSEGVWGVLFVLWLLLLFLDGLAIHNWSLWLWVFSGIGNNWGISFDSSVVHWDLLLFFLGFLGLSLLSRLIFSLGSNLLSFLLSWLGSSLGWGLFLSWSSFLWLSLFLLSGGLLLLGLTIGILLHVLS